MKFVSLAFTYLLSILNCIALSDTISWSEAELEQSAEALIQARQMVLDEKIPLLENLRTDHEALEQIRHEQDLLQNESKGIHAQISGLEQAVLKNREELLYQGNALFGYRKKFQEHLHISELDEFEETFLKSDLAFESGLSTPETVEQLAETTLESIDRLSQMIGGQVKEGEAITSDGIQTAGEILYIGPFAYFLSTEGSGVLEEGKNLNLLFRELDNRAALAEVIEHHSGTLPIDPKVDQAFRIMESEDGLVEHIRKGGLWMIPILLSGLVAILIAALKSLQVNKLALPAGIDRKDILTKPAHPGIPDMIREILKIGKAYKSSSPTEREAAMHSLFIDYRSKLESGLSLISITAATAPLLGLLGTVTGMIKTFHMISLYGTGDAKSLSSGISEALITTEFGLIVAIPALIFHAILQRRVKKILSRTLSLIDRLNHRIENDKKA